jgi:hypothetical protein
MSSTRAVWNMANSLWDNNDPNSRLAWIARSAPRTSWEKFLTLFQPEPGEHMAIIGTTGSGKTHLQNCLLFKWPFVAAFATKNNDNTMDRLISEKGYERFARWSRFSPVDHPRRIIWPPAKNLKTMTDAQEEIFSDAMEKIWAEGGRPKDAPVGWAIAMDESWWFNNVLNLGKYIKIYLLQGRSNGISLLSASQRPKNIPTEVYSMSTHLFFFAETDRINLERIGEINYRESAGVRYIVNNLDPRQVLYVNTRTGIMVRTRAPAPAGS